MTREMGFGQSFDLGIRRFHLQGIEVDLYFVNGLADTERFVRGSRDGFAENIIEIRP